MPPRHSRDQQPRENWPVNEPREPVGAAAADASGHPRRARRIIEEANSMAANADGGGRTAVATPAEGAVEAPAEPSEAPGRDSRTVSPTGDMDFATYVEESLKQRQSAPRHARAEEEQESFERVGLGTLYRSGELRTDDRYDDTVLGLNYSTVTQRAPVGDERWAFALRRFARAAVWILPAGVVLLALSSLFGWPTETSEPALVSPGTWVVVTALGLGLWLLGLVALAALAAVSPVRPWAILAVAASTLGVALLGPVIGAVGFGRPAITRAALETPNDPAIAGAAGQMQQRLLDNTVGRSLVVAGGVLLGVGALAIVITILGSRVLQRHDGWLILAGVAIAAVGAYLSWEFLFVLAAMLILAGCRGLAYTVSRIAPDGTAPPAY